MRFLNFSQYPDDEVRQLVTMAMRDVDTVGVAVHVKNSRRGAYRGMAYDGVPAISRAARHKRTRYLITIGIGAPDRFPVDNLVSTTRNGVTERHPYGGKRSPLIEMADWREALVAVAAHEARHIQQFQWHARRSEVDAERFAARALQRYRAELTTLANQPAARRGT